ncbi:MAG: 23S rRNA (guanosine(2251)-2'-O)-methyltransferase RlmB [Endomicrobiales bacterium]
MPEIISGRNPVRELLRSGQKTINKILLSRQARGSAIEDILRLAKERGIPLHHVPPERLDALSTENNQGVVAEVSSAEYLGLHELWEKVKNDENPVLVVLDGIEDPQNMGAIIRNAVAFGASGIVIGKWRSAALTETVSKTSAGAVEHIPIARIASIANALQELKDRGVWIVGAEAGGRSVRDEKFAFPLALVIGSEGQGLHRLVKERCDFLVSIPQTSAISSLNASCAAAILLYEIFRRKQFSS